MDDDGSPQGAATGATDGTSIGDRHGRTDAGAAQGPYPGIPTARGGRLNSGGNTEFATPSSTSNVARRMP